MTESAPSRSTLAGRLLQSYGLAEKLPAEVFTIQAFLNVRNEMLKLDAEMLVAKPRYLSVDCHAVEQCERNAFPEIRDDTVADADFRAGLGQIDEIADQPQATELNGAMLARTVTKIVSSVIVVENALGNEDLSLKAAHESLKLGLAHRRT
jgi:hypothetical protein